MKSVATYLNSLPRDEQERFAARCGTTVGYLRKAASVGTLLREKLCSRIERFSDGAVPRQTLRPDDWQEIWPELAAFQEKPAPALTQQAPEAFNHDVQGGAHG